MNKPAPDSMKDKWYRRGRNPDYRFTLANERTFLAWLRTSLAFLAGSIILWGFAGGRVGDEFLLVVASVALAALSALVGASAYLRWRQNELSMRLDERLPHFPLLGWLAGAVAMLGTLFTLWLFFAAK